MLASGNLPINSEIPSCRENLPKVADQVALPVNVGGAVYTPSAAHWDPIYNDNIIQTI